MRAAAITRRLQPTTPRAMTAASPRTAWPRCAVWRLLWFAAAITVMRWRSDDTACSTGRPLRTAHGDGFHHFEHATGSTRTRVQ
jgi:hypothetical protein